MKKIAHFLFTSVLLQLLIGSVIKFQFPDIHFAPFLSWSNYSVVILFMTVGLQLKFEKMSSEFLTAINLVATTTFIPIILLFFACRAFGIDSSTAFVCSVILVTTGTGVTIQTLSSLGLIQSKIGQFIILISALDDIPAALLMAYLLHGTPSPSTQFSTVFLIICIMSLILAKFRRGRWIKASLFVIAALSLARLLEGANVSLVIGGLVSGFGLKILFGETTEEAIEPINTMLTPILPFYLIWVGMKLTPSALLEWQNLLILLTLTFVACSSKWVTSYLTVRHRKELNPSMVSWGLVPRGLPGFAFASSTVAANLISSEIFSLMVGVVCLSTWIGLLGIELSARKMIKRNLATGESLQLQ